MSSRLSPLRVATWTAGALGLGWVATAVGALALPGGHPPAAFVIGEGVVLVSFLLAPVGAGAALVDLRRARRRIAAASPRAVVMLGLNLLLLLVAVALWVWIWWAATRR